MRKSKFSDNQGKCCDAALRILEEREGALRTAQTFPEKEHHRAPVEIVCMIGSTLYALEHTKVEAYFKQMEDSAHFVGALEPLEASLFDCLPKHAWYTLVVQPNSFKGVSPSKIGEIREKIREWIIYTAPSLKPPGYKMVSKTEYIDGVPFAVTLQASSAVPSFHGKFKIARYAPSDLETLRSDNLKLTLEKKLPKLQHWANEGANTVLILESEDIALTNHGLVLDALKTNLPDLTFRPDHVFFVYAMGDTWLVQTLIAFKKFPEFPYPYSYREFNVADLSNILE